MDGGLESRFALADFGVAADNELLDNFWWQYILQVISM